MAAAVLLALASCSTIDPNNRVAAWPDLRVVEHYVSGAEMYAQCKRYVSAGMLPLGCAAFHLDAGECHLWFDERPARWVVEHERMHCLGYDHVGDDSMARMYREWLAR